MTTWVDRSKQVGGYLFLAAVVFPLLEIPRAAAIATCIVPMLVVGGVEYLVTGKNDYMESMANAIEFGGKESVKKLAREMNIRGRVC